jgi:formiminoglutamase
MSLKLFFNPIPASAIAPSEAKKLLHQHVAINTGKLPRWKGANVAIIGVPEYRGEGQLGVNDLKMNPIRQELYRMASLSRPLKIVDLGDLRPGPDLEDTYRKLAEVCEMLMNADTFPLLIGGTHDLDYGQFLAYQPLEKMITVLNVDATLDLDAEAPLMADQHINRILVHLPNYLFEYSHLGYQRFYVDKTAVDTLLRLNFELKSVGQIRDNIAEIEPQIRSADMLSFDLCAIRRTDAFAHPKSHPFGLTGDEACQICWYAGMSEKLTSLGIYGYHTELDRDQHSAAVVATMIWYFLEGYAHRQQEVSFKSSFYIKYIVPLAAAFESNDHHITDNLIFYKSRISDKWWMEVSAEGLSGEHYNRNVIIPCSYSDFEIANTGSIPDRWFKALDKLV